MFTEDVFLKWLHSEMERVMEKMHRGEDLSVQETQIFMLDGQMNHIQTLDREIKQRMDHLGQRMDHLESEVVDTRKELKGDIETLRGELKGHIETLRGELKGDIETLRGGMKGDIETLRGGMKDLGGEMKEGTKDLRTEMQGGMKDLRGDMLSQHRWTLGLLVGIFLSISAMILPILIKIFK